MTDRFEPYPQDADVLVDSEGNPVTVTPIDLASAFIPGALDPRDDE